MTAHVAPPAVVADEQRPQIQRRYSTFRPDPSLTATLARAFPPDLRFPVDTLDPEGRTVLVVTDRISGTDLESGRIFAGEEGVVWDNVVDYALSQVEPGSRLGRIILLPWALSWTADNDRTNTETFGRCLSHLKRVVAHTQPDCIVLAGFEMAEYVFQHCNHGPAQLIIPNRIQDLDIDGTVWPTVPTIDLHRLCSFDKEKIKKFPNLIGFFAAALVTAFNGFNRYTIPNFKQQTKVIRTMTDFNIFYAKLLRQPRVSIDCETNGLQRRTTTLYTAQFAFNARQAYFLPLDHFETPFTPDELVTIKLRLRDYFERGTSEFHVYQNGKYDIGQFITHLGLRYYNHRVFDITAGEYALDENRKLLDDFRITKSKVGLDRYRAYTLDRMAEERGCTIYRHTAFSKGDRGNVAQEGLTPRFVEYSCYDVTIPFAIMETQTAEAERRGHTKYMAFVTEQMSDTVVTFAHLENAGLLLDKRYLLTLLDRQGPVVKVIDETLAAFKRSTAAQAVNAHFLRRQGLPTRNLFGSSEWVFSVKKRDHAQMLFFDVLGLEPLTQTKDGGGKLDKNFRAKYVAKVPEVQTFEDYAKIITIYNNFVKPLSYTMENDKDALHDGRIRASFWFTEVVTSRTSSCLDPDTPVYVLDARGQVPIKDIRAGDWVWSFDDSLKPVAKQVSWQGRTKHSETLTVTYQSDKGDTFKQIVCTPCHPWRLRDGSYRRADQLRPGDRTLALERRYTAAGYRTVTYTGMPRDKGKVFEHRLAKGTPSGLFEHHRDEVKDNNALPNLETVTKDYHHRVVKVERNEGRRWTYDITVPGTNNFVANGVVVHNSNPNFQNIPQHGKLAKLVKRLFIARRGRLGVENDYSAHEVRDWANQAGDEVLCSSFYAGLRYRQDLRILAYENPAAVEQWTGMKEGVGWDVKGSDMKKADNRLVYIAALNDMVVRALADLDFNIDAKGDIHRLNYQHFFGVDVLQVTDPQRQSVKAVVFGTIYGKTAKGLAEQLGISDAEAQKLQDTLFEKFAQGGGWIKETEAFGQQHLYVETPCGMHRHLWGYLHARSSVINAMNRRGPNSKIQGTASNIGIASMRIMQRLIWQFFIAQGLYFPSDALVNYVHDSAKGEVDIQLIPIYLYLMEHASTTLVHKRMRETFGYEMKIGLELEFQIGAAGSRVDKWNFMENDLMRRIRTEIDWQNQEFGFGLDADAYLGAVKHNWDLLAPIRLAELKEATGSTAPSETMLLTPRMVKGMGFKLDAPGTAHRPNRFDLAA